LLVKVIKHPLSKKVLSWTLQFRVFRVATLADWQDGDEHGNLRYVEDAALSNRGPFWL
jgi:hypothetical protein